MILKLVVTTNASGDVFELRLTEEKYGVGRRHDNDLRIRETYVSGYHAELHQTADGDYELKDLGSSNGTYLNGDQISSPQIIKAGDFIKFGILKVAVKEDPSTDTKPKIVSLKDRPAFAKQRNGQTSSIPGALQTGEISPEGSESSDPISGPGEPEGSDKTEKTIEELREKLEKKDVENRRLSEKAQSTLNAKAELQTKIESLETDLTQREVEIAAAKKTAFDELKKSSKLQKAIDQLQSDLDSSEKTSTGTSNELDLLKSELAAAQAELNKSKEDSKSRQELTTSLSKKLEEARSEATKNQEALESQLKTKEKELTAQQQKLETLESDIEDKDLKLSDAAVKAAEFAALTVTLESLTEELEKSQKESEATLKRQIELESEIKVKASDLSVKSSELEALKESISEKDESISNLAEQAGKVARLETGLSEARAELHNQKTTASTKEEELNLKVRELEQSQSELEGSLRRREEQLATTTSELTSALDMAHKEASTLTLRAERLDVIVTQLKEQAKAAEQEAAKQYSALEATLAEERNALEQTRKALSEADAELKRFQDEAVVHKGAPAQLDALLKRQQGVLSSSDVFEEKTIDLETNGFFSEEDFYRKLISKLDLLDDLMKRYENKWRFPKVAEQLNLLKNAFLDLLEDHSVSEFNLEPGTQLSVEERKRIKLVPMKEGVPQKVSGSGNGHSEVIETIRPGYVYQTGARDIIIRKAEVVVA